MHNTNYNYLQDIDFLHAFDKVRMKKLYLKMCVLDKYERVIDELTTKVKDSGTIDMDGSSAVRRTCTLTLALNDYFYEDYSYIENLLSINNRASLFIGFENNLKEQFPKYRDLDIIWFPLGIFLILNPSYNHTMDGLNITLNLSDKMTLLNGENGGTIPASVDLDKLETFVPERDDENQLTGKMISAYNTPVSVKDIIYELVNHLGKEQLAKIIIDIPEKVKTVKNSSEYKAHLFKFPNLEKEIYYGYLSKDDGDTSGDVLFNKNTDIGFALEQFNYPSDKGLTASAGSAVTESLDTLAKTLDNYEYFYDINGNFVFQEIKNYLNTSQSMDVLNIFKSDLKIDYSTDKFRSKSVYNFTDDIIESISNNPQYELIKNDFIIWGKTPNAEVPIRYHLVLDDLPKTENKKYEDMYFLEIPMVALDGVYDTVNGQTQYTQTIVKLETFDNTHLLKKGLLGVFYLNTDTNVVYTFDGLEFQKLEDTIGKSYNSENYIVHTPEEAPYIAASDWRTQFFLDGVCSENEGISANDYYIELKSEWPKIIDVKKLFKNVNTPKTLNALLKDNLDKSNIQYFLDILDTSDEIRKFNVSSIGRRTEVILEDDSGANCIFENDIPGYCYIRTEVKKDDNPATNHNNLLAQVNKFQEEINTILESNYIPVLLTNDDYIHLSTGGKLNSAYEIAKNAIYQYTTYNEQVTLETLPIYYLEPNTRINVVDEKTGINGDFIIKTISYPLNIDGSMNIVCSRALNKL